MVYNGRPSMGCENCRKAKKRCDQALPSCGRCVRLGKSCGGYRDIADLMFKDESKSVTERLGGTVDSRPRHKQPSPNRETAARQFFLDNFVTSNHLSSLQETTLDDSLTAPILACAFVVMANRNADPQVKEFARYHYVEAIAATNAALRDTQQAKEDSTLIAVALLGIYERCNWQDKTSVDSWTHHVRGTALVLQMRGRSQIRTKIGAALFRDMRSDIVVHALASENAVPDYIVQWTQVMEYDARYAPIDQLTVLASRLATLRFSLKAGTMTDTDAFATGEVLEKDLIGWSENNLAAGTHSSFHNVLAPDSPHSWSGIRHEAGTPNSHRWWNMWRSLRIMLNRMQEDLWRRSWPILVQPTVTIPDADHFRSIRLRMASDICIAAAYALGSDNTAEPPQGSVASGYLLINPLGVAGTVLIEQIAEISESHTGSRQLLLNRAYHLDATNPHSKQLAWLLDRVDYINDVIGVKWGRSISRFLKGELNMSYCLARSTVIYPPESAHASVPDLANISSSSPLAYQ